MARRSARTRWILLGLLSWGPATGYELKVRIARSVGMFWSESDGQLYPTLKALAEEGLIAPDGPPETRGRQAYRVTPAGLAALRDWLAAPPAPASVRDESVLKMFFGNLAPPGAVEEHLRGEREQLAAELAQLERVVDQLGKAGDPGAPWRARTAAYGLHMGKARMAFLEGLLAELDAERAPEQG